MGAVRAGQCSAVNENATILVVDDVAQNSKLLSDILEVKGYQALTASSGAEALATIATMQPDLVLLDIMMPAMDGYEVCRRIRQNPATEILPVIMVTALDPAQERVKGLQAGADDFLGKPINHAELLARVRSLLRIKSLFETVTQQAAELEHLNRTLEQRVQQQVTQIERLGRLRRFLSPQISELIVSSGDESCLDSHRREIATAFCDLRGFTAFAETAEPEDTVQVLTEYHHALGELIIRYDATIDHRAGDGVMVFFNDPLPCEQPALQAVRMALAMQTRIADLIADWRKRGHELGFGIGIGLGYATIGLLGYADCCDYTATGRAVNLASRLCDNADNSQILISQRVYAEVEPWMETEFVANLSVKGFQQPVPVYNVRSEKSLTGKASSSSS